MTRSLMIPLIAGLAFAKAAPPELRVTMISLGVTDMARAVKFYGDTLRLQLVGNPGEVTLFRAGDITIVLNGPAGQAAGNALVGAVEIIFPAGSVASSHEQLLERGCKFISMPREVTPGTWAATFTDPDGHRLTILGPR